jgi:hypothetical protein
VLYRLKKYITKDPDIELTMEEVVYSAEEGCGGLCRDERVRWWIYGRVERRRRDGGAR